MNKAVMDMIEKSGCKWPDCKCHVPSYALSAHNRVEFCEALKAYYKKETTE